MPRPDPFMTGLVELSKANEGAIRIVRGHYAIERKRLLSPDEQAGPGG